MIPPKAPVVIIDIRPRTERAITTQRDRIKLAADLKNEKRELESSGYFTKNQLIRRANRMVQNIYVVK